MPDLDRQAVTGHHPDQNDKHGGNGQVGIGTVLERIHPLLGDMTAPRARAEALGDPCTFCPTSCTPSTTILIDIHGQRVYLCFDCELMFVRGEVGMYADMIRRHITEDAGKPWWMTKRKFYRLNLQAENIGLKIANSRSKRIGPNPCYWKAENNV